MTTDYLVEMKLTPVSTIPSPAEGIAFTERFVLPTLEACEKLAASGNIIAGGPALGAMNFSFVLRADSPQQAEELVTALPLWPRSQTAIAPLGSFQHRATAVRHRLATLKATLSETAVASPAPVRTNAA